MTKSLYLFRDVKSGEYEFYGVFVNDEVAKRAFLRACQDPAVFGEDLELYRSANLDTRSGKCYFEDKNIGFGSNDPEFICGGANVSDKV